MPSKFILFIYWLDGVHSHFLCFGLFGAPGCKEKKKLVQKPHGGPHRSESHRTEQGVESLKIILKDERQFLNHWTMAMAVKQSLGGKGAIIVAPK